MATIYVNPSTGSDRGDGSQSAPYKTLTHALKQAESGTLIQLETGTYNSANGEAFPLMIPAGVTVVGNESGTGSGILIEGSGRYSSPSTGGQEVTIAIAENAELRGVTVTNSQVRGTGVWIESASCNVVRCTFTRCRREGVYATGSGIPNILSNVFVDNEGYGLSLEGSAKGEVLNNTFQSTGYGISIKDNAATRIGDNTLFENRSGILIAGNATPVLRRNLIERNTGDGVVITNDAVPDFGNAREPGGNMIRNNGGFDINHAGTQAIASFGNLLDAGRVQGQIRVVVQSAPTSAPPTLYVNSSTGSDSGSGSQSAPFKTIAHALRQAEPGTVVLLAPGNYSAATGEAFPLFVPSGVTLAGNEAAKGEGIQITGSGRFTSPSAAGQNITVLMEHNSAMRGVSVTNDQIRGTGAWIESVYCVVANCQFANSKREGIFVTGTGIPEIVGNHFEKNAGNGMALAGNAKGEIRGNKFEDTGYAIAVQAQAAPLISENQILNNRTGIVLSGSSKPVLRKNVIEKNLQDGLTVIAEALPDLGSDQDSGGNIFRDNGKYDVQNAGKFKLISVGNEINPSNTRGDIEFDSNIVPPPTPPTPPTPPPPTDDEPFSDVAGHWAREFIIRLANMDIISGFPDGSFRPNENLTRAQHAALLAKAFELTPIREATAFKDVAIDFWAKMAIERANRAGFLAGFPDRSFRPNQNLTRAQAIVSLINGLKLTGGNPNSLGTYTDRAQIPSYATEAIATATDSRIVVNYPSRTTLSPQRDITRAEISAILYQTLVAIDRAQAIDSPYIV
ncbi:DUF1565 domain-containing protein [Lyngbya sp. CCY1209]|uniref:DUF1565 domain-containing protein n=1 Tax=Lyngbya sp. CCY1209 TaxID=2886103 RepID=UPI002D20CE7A|nr:DUF1565 domain-containing protein [Lyngbya sp. CCY1209]MEB3884745.1 DUF1565 domain-containing protein [Lyngbya sp. CCY1209]